MSLAYGEDLSEYFPTELDLALQNRKLFEEMHVVAEQGSPLFRTLHPAFSRTLHDMSDERMKQLVVQGVGLYEIAAAFDATNPTGVTTLIAIARAGMAVEERSTYELLAEGSESLEESIHEVPRLMALGPEVLGRYADGSKDLVGYGLIGIALARLYDMSSAVEATRLEIQSLD